MNCYDCATQDHLARHAAAREHHLTRTQPINRIVVVEPAGRTLRCTTCDAAYTAAHSPAA